MEVLLEKYVPGLSSKTFVIHGVVELFEERESRRDLGLCPGIGLNAGVSKCPGKCPGKAASHEL
jgi:hypothetical protein